MPKSTRADKLLVEKGLAETRTKAQALIMSGKVFSANKRIKPVLFLNRIRHYRLQVKTTPMCLGVELS